MKTIHKYPLPGDENTFEMPIGAHVLHVHAQGDTAYLWALVDTTAALELRRFNVYATGHELECVGKLEYLGTIHPFDSMLVFHVFESFVK